MHSRGENWVGRWGFTLVELLAVIAIILILVSLLMPSLAKFKMKAATVYCFNNMRQIVGGSVTYTSDNKGRPPSPNWGPTGNHTPYERGWLYAEGKMDMPEDLQQGLLWPYIRDPRAYKCYYDPLPDYNDPYAVPQRPGNSRMLTSYCMNGAACVFGKGDYFTAPDGLGRWNTFALSEYKEDDIFFWETWWEQHLRGSWWDGANNVWEGITYRHDFGGVVGTVYGGAEWMDTNTYFKLAAESIRNRLWNVPHSPNGRSLPP